MPYALMLILMLATSVVAEEAAVGTVEQALAAETDAPQIETTDRITACYASLQATDATAMPCIEALQIADDLEQQAQIASALAVIMARSGDLLRAEEFMEQALTLQPTNPNVLINLGNLRIKQQRFNEAIEVYGRAQDYGALEEPALYLNRSLALRALGRYDDAKKDYDYFLTLKSQRPATVQEFNSDTVE